MDKKFIFEAIIELLKAIFAFVKKMITGTTEV